MEFKERIKLLREKNNMTLEEVAKLAGVSAPTIQRYETGEIKNVRKDKIPKLAKALNTTPAHLMGWDNDDLDKEDLGKALREEREYQSISLEELAKYIGISVELLEQYEEDEIPMSEFVIEKACEFFSIPYYEFLEKYNRYDEEIPEIFNGDVEKYEAFKRAKEKDIENEYTSNIKRKELPSKWISIKIYGKIPAGVPLYALEDIRGEVDIPAHWLLGNKEFIALEIDGDSMHPKYFPGDIVILQVSCDCENGQDCAVYVNGDDATFKKVLKGENYITLQPYNTAYEAKTFTGEQIKELKILGVAKEIRRKI